MYLYFDPEISHTYIDLRISLVIKVTGYRKLTGTFFFIFSRFTRSFEVHPRSTRPNGRPGDCGDTRRSRIRFDSSTGSWRRRNLICRPLLAASEEKIALQSHTYHMYIFARQSRSRGASEVTMRPLVRHCFPFVIQIIWCNIVVLT